MRKIHILYNFLPAKIYLLEHKLITVFVEKYQHTNTQNFFFPLKFMYLFEILFHFEHLLTLDFCCCVFFLKIFPDLLSTITLVVQLLCLVMLRGKYLETVEYVNAVWLLTGWAGWLVLGTVRVAFSWSYIYQLES